MADPAPSFPPPRRRLRTSRQSRRPDGRVDRRTGRDFATGGRRAGRRSRRDARSPDREPLEDGALRALRPACCALVSRSPQHTRSTPRRNSDAAAAPRFAPCPERRCALLQTWTAIPPLRSRLLQLPEPPRAPLPRKPRTTPNEASRSPQGVAPLNGAAMVAAALTGGLRRAEPPAPAAPAAVSKAATSNAAASSDARAPTPSLLDRLAVKSILDNLRRPEARAPASQTAPTPGALPPPPPQPRRRRTPRRRPPPLPAVSATSLASSPPTACKPDATRKRSRAPPRPGPLFLPRWRRWNGRRRPGSS